MYIKPLLVNTTSAKQALNVGNTKFHELKKDPRFPKARYPNGKNRPMYLLSELEKYVESI